ncbi:MAG: hypothetical protein LBK95_15920 [Bifidobacteriaceae bacterium]|jgi:hypothetical protein|nr:hypothetical protein [Bifidobacteriaceae bacterium]
MNQPTNPGLDPPENAPEGVGGARDGGIVYGRVGIQLAAFAGVLAVGGGVAGYVAVGTKGMWGALLGAAIVGAFFGASALVMHLSKTAEAQARNLLLAWFGKLVVLFVLMLALNQAAFINRPTFGITILVGVIGSLVLEGRVVWGARVTPGPELPPRQG